MLVYTIDDEYNNEWSVCIIWVHLSSEYIIDIDTYIYIDINTYTYTAIYTYTYIAIYTYIALYTYTYIDICWFTDDWTVSLPA